MVRRMIDNKKPSALALVGLTVLFVAVTVGAKRLVPKLFGWETVDYGDLALSAASLTQNLLVPTLAATVLVAVIVSVLGWWRPVMKEQLRVPRWKQWIRCG